MRYLRQKRRHYLFLRQLFPVNPFKKGMVFNLLYSVAPQSVLRLPLDQPVHKIHTLPTPAVRWNFIELYLLCQYFFADFFTVGTYVGSLNVE